ncbi:uncharacterized protein LOC143552669 [Bidens hawaiensis]|uniref:uncharacterized protein LOC143552669 n=1 Tax=Bidens hawaiensis TaxID=980011 RepID=UPI00404B7FB9
MIYKAILELNKKGGSNEESISEYIQKEYAELPWAHSTLLKHHLEKLCDRKEICMTHNECYLIAVAESEPEEESNGPGKKHKRQTGRADSEAGKKSSRARKKHRKNEKTGVGIQEVKDEEQIGLHKRKRKKGLKSKRKGNKRAKKHTINEDSKLQLADEASLKQNTEVIVDESHEQNQMLEVKMDDVQVQESDQLQMNKDPEILQTEQSPDSNPVLHGNGKRVSPRLHSKKDALSSYKQLISSSASVDKPLIECIKPISIDVRDPIGSQQDQEHEKLPDNGEFVYKRRGRPSKCMVPEKDEVLGNSKPAAGSRKSQRSTKKGKVGNKKGQPKCKHHGGKKMIRRSSRKKTKS